MDKIRISSDDVSRVGDLTPPAPSAPSAPSVPPVLPESPFALPPQASSRQPLLLWILGGVAALLLLVGAIFFGLQLRGPSVERWAHDQIAPLNKQLNESPRTKEYIESIHPLVTFKNAAVKSIHASTVDGSQRAGTDGRNISELEYVVTYRWEGPVNKSGYTEVQYVWDMPNHQLKTTRYLDSNAVMNLDNIDWFKLGVQLAPLFFGGN